MSNHLHMVSRREEGLLSDLLKDFKSYTSKQILKLIEDNPAESRKEWLMYMLKYFARFHKQNSEYMFWQRSNHPTELYSPKVMVQKIEYIHQNPVRAGIVSNPEDYVYSSASPLSKLVCLNP